MSYNDIAKREFLLAIRFSVLAYVILQIVDIVFSTTNTFLFVTLFFLFLFLIRLILARNILKKPTDEPNFSLYRFSRDFHHFIFILLSAPLVVSQIQLYVELSHLENISRQLVALSGLCAILFLLIFLYVFFSSMKIRPLDSFEFHHSDAQIRRIVRQELEQILENK